MEQLETTTIKPKGAWIDLDLREIWAYRELLYFLTWRDVKIRYKQTAIGVAWAILQPVLTTAIFTLLFSRFAGFDTGDIPYPLFAFSGLMIWLFVHNAISMASNSFVSNTNLVTKVYFPRLIMPVAAALAGFFDLLISFVILTVLMIYYEAALTWQIIFVPIFVLMAVLLAVAFGTLFSALNVRFRDVKFALPFLLQVWMIASPIFYPMNLLSAKWRVVFALNPLTGIVEGFRSALFAASFDLRIIGVSSVSLVVLTLFSLFVFKKMEDDFADLI
jgi:lipopolysaccharide transport system permease protein